MPIPTDPDRPEAQAEGNVITPWEESPLKTLWREVSEGRYPSLERVKEIMRNPSSDKTLGELIVERRRRR